MRTRLRSTPDEGDRALGEVDRLGRLEDEHEAEGEEGVDRALGEAAAEGGDEPLGAAAGVGLVQAAGRWR